VFVCQRDREKLKDRKRERKSKKKVSLFEVKREILCVFEFVCL